MLLYDSKSQKIKELTPVGVKDISIYVCGITPYDTTHLGHAFTYVFFDVLVRFLRYKQHTVKYLQNVTDIDDDILRKAKEQNTDWKSLGQSWTKKYLTDMKNLNVLPPTWYVKATDSMDKIVEMVSKLLKEGYAYSSGSNIYFDVSEFSSYGDLSHYSEKQMIQLSRERGADPDDKNKKNPLDFILWQAARPDEPVWEGPMEIKGRPGWHIECSAMINQYLGAQITIHGGGRDLIFPHHESERAQSEAYTGKDPFVDFWMHTAMVMYQGEKMSKSLGNLILISDLLKTYDADTIRYVLLSHHYRTPWEFMESELEEAKEKVLLLHRTLSTKLKSSNDTNQKMKEFSHALEDDMNTPKALEIMQQTHHSSTLRQMSDLLGFMFR